MDTQLIESREEKIKSVLKKMLGDLLPIFYWDNKSYEEMTYRYNPDNDRIELCDYDIGIPVEMKTEDISTVAIQKIIWNLRKKVYNDFLKNRNIDLGYCW